MRKYPRNVEEKDNYLSLLIFPNLMLNLFVDFEENEDIAYAFVNGLAAGKDEKNKEIEGKNEEE